MEAYATIVEVSVQCATYYTTKGYSRLTGDHKIFAHKTLIPDAGRWIMAVFKPNKFQAIVQKLQASIEHVQVDCGDLLSQNIYKIKASNEGKKLRYPVELVVFVLTMLSELQQKAEDLQKRLTRGHYTSG